MDKYDLGWRELQKKELEPFDIFLNWLTVAIAVIVGGGIVYFININW